MSHFRTFTLAATVLAAISLATCGGGGSQSNTVPVPPAGGGGGSGNGGNGGSGNGGEPTTSPVSLANPGDILVNQHGYMAESQKLASLVRSEQAPVPWQLIDGADRIYASGDTVYSGQSPLSGLTIHRIDFSNYQRNASDLRLKVGTKTSEEFDIRTQPYRELARDSAKYFYQSRAASAVEDKYVPLAFPPLSRPAGHTNQSLTCFTGTDFNGTEWPSCGHNQTIDGGWYDAGDFGRYAVNTGTTIWVMQNLFERLQGDQSSCKIPGSAVAELNIPESEDSIHDLLNESRVGMELLLSLQMDTDTPIAMAMGAQAENAPLTLTQRSARDMVFHKVHGAQWPVDNTAPVDDVQQIYLYPPSTSSTLHLAATGAQCARVWRSIDEAFADRCQSAAVRAYNAAKATPDAYAYDNFDGGGPYADQNLRDEFSWAATELFLTTGEAEYRSDILTYTPDGYAQHGRVQPSWRDTEPLGPLSIAAQYAKDSTRVATPLEQEALDALKNIAVQYKEQIELTGFAVPDDDTSYYWGSNSNLFYRGILMAHVNDLPDGPDYENEVISVMNYILGHNPLSQSYVSGYGDQSVENLHHRFWAYAIDRTLPKPPAGLLSGGPQNTALIDPVSRELEGQCLAQTCWLDEYDAYSFNEVSISWNAGLIWNADWLAGRTKTCE